MPFKKTSFSGLLIFEPNVFEDSRGYFFESYNASLFESEGLDIRFVQDNQARSEYGVIRGLHYQAAPFSQTKLVRTLSGSILDVVVDMRSDSPMLGKVFSIELTAENRLQLLVPKGFAHGYSVLSQSAEVFYKVDTLYNKESEGGIAYNDPALQIDWQITAGKEIVSQKDLVQPLFSSMANKDLF